MAWPLRMLVPSGIYFVTVRCFQGRLFLRPSRRTNEVLGGVLARAVRMTGVDVFAFVFASNHVHLLVRAPRGNLPKFMQFLLGNTARKVGWLIGWRGTFWERRYAAEPVLDDDALLGRLRYILSHGVKEGLVRKCRGWPGLTCLRMLLQGKARAFRWFSWTRRWTARTSQEGDDRFNERWQEAESFALTVLPSWSTLSRGRRARQILSMVAAIEREWEAVYPQVLGRRKVLAQHPKHRPARPERSPGPRCHGTRLPERLEFLEQYRSYATSFLTASARWRHGDLAAQFPPQAVRPFLWPPPMPLAA
jgi:REP element-mobilizing transposase RayT